MSKKKRDRLSSDIKKLNQSIEWWDTKFGDTPGGKAVLEDLRAIRDDKQKQKNQR